MIYIDTFIVMKLFGIAAIIVSLVVVWYVIIKLHGQVGQSNRQNCIFKAGQDEVTAWNTACRTYGVNTTGDNCNLPDDIAAGIRSSWRGAQDVCLEQYPQQ